MRKVWFITLIVFAAIGLLASAFAVTAVLRVIPVSAANTLQLPGWMPMMGWFSRGNVAQTGCSGYGVGGGYGMMGRGGWGMMGGYRSYSNNGNLPGSCPYTGTAQPPATSAERLTIDQALEKVRDYIGSDANLTVAEVMEFDQNFYAIVLEKDSGRGAMELLVDPFSGSVFPEFGPNMMWNQKYGHMRNWIGRSEKVSLEEAVTLAQKALDAQVPGAIVEEDGVAFYGYFTFDYTVDGKVAGMLSVNAVTGDAWRHTWHGAFISETELVK